MHPSPDEEALLARIGLVMGCSPDARTAPFPYHYGLEGLVRSRQGLRAPEVARLITGWPVEAADAQDGYINIKLASSWCLNALIRFAKLNQTVPSIPLPGHWLHALRSGTNALERQKSPFILSCEGSYRAVGMLHLVRATHRRRQEAGEAIVDCLIGLAARGLREQLSGEDHFFLYIGVQLLGALSVNEKMSN